MAAGRTILCALALGAAAPAGAAHAQGDALASLEAVAIESLCSGRGVLRYAFGDARTEAVIMAEDSEENPIFPPSFGPFTTISFYQSDRSERVFGAAYDAEFGSEAESLAAMSRLAARFGSLGWERIADEAIIAREFRDIVVDPRVVMLVLGAQPGDPGEPRGVKLLIAPTSSQGFRVECVDRRLEAEARREALGGPFEGALPD